jgi:hypothetical protein
MTTTKQRADRQKDKEKKEKILLAVLVLILIVVGAVMIPGMLKTGGSPPAVAQTTGQTTGASPSGNSGTPNVSGGSASGPPGAATFPEASTYQPLDGQLSGFGRFDDNDPFANLPGQAEAGSTSPTSSSTTSPSGSSYAAAVISINGASSTVTLHSAFPASSKAFTLESITNSAVTVSVTNGSFTGEQSLVTIRKGHTVVLENTVDGTRYALKMISAVVGGGTSGGATTTTIP